jgi:hypothetical protein
MIYRHSFHTITERGKNSTHIARLLIQSFYLQMTYGTYLYNNTWGSNAQVHNLDTQIRIRPENSVFLQAASHH